MKRETGAIPVHAVLLLLYVPVLLLGLSCAGGGWYYRQQMYQRYVAEEQRFHAAANKYLAVNDEARLVREYYSCVRDLHGRGVLGPELRLDWIEFLQQAGGRPGLPALHYRIGPQAEYQPAQHKYQGSYRIYYSPMHIDIDLLHEGDLHAFFAELDRRNMGIYSVVSCRLTRLHSVIDPAVITGNIRAECELAWFNIRKQDGGMVGLT